MDSIVLFRIDTDLGDSQYSSEHGMVGEKDVIKVDFTGLRIIDKVAVSVVNTVKQEAGEIHGYKIKVHAFDAKWKGSYFLTL